MTELTFDQRMDVLESLLANMVTTMNNLSTSEERQEVVDIIFRSIEDLEDRIVALKNTLNMIEAITSNTNGN